MFKFASHGISSENFAREFPYALPLSKCDKRQKISSE